MPSKERPGLKGIYIELEPALLERIRSLADKHRRAFKEEVAHALVRHADQPPEMVTPELSPVVVEVPGLPAPKKRGPKPKPK